MATAALVTLERLFPDGHRRMGRPLLVLAELAHRDGRHDEVLTLTERIRNLDLPMGSETVESELLRIQTLATLNRGTEARRTLDDLRSAAHTMAMPSPSLTGRINDVAGSLGL